MIEYNTCSRMEHGEHIYININGVFIRYVIRFVKPKEIT